MGTHCDWHTVGMSPKSVSDWRAIFNGLRAFSAVHGLQGDVILDQNLDKILNDAPCDTMMVQTKKKKTGEHHQQSTVLRGGKPERPTRDSTAAAAKRVSRTVT